MIPIRKIWLLGLLIISATSVQAQNSSSNVLRVCSDPNNLPYSNRDEQGFENKIAEVIALDLQRELEYTWFPQRMGFIRNTLKSWDDTQGRFLCDLVIGVPAGFDISDTTTPYYRSTYAIVIREDGPLGHIDLAKQLAELPEGQKQALRIGAFAPSPSVDWLIRYGLYERTTFYQIMTGDPDYYPGKIIEDELVPGNLDVVIIWGPIAGYFANQWTEAALKVIPLFSEPGIRFDFAMSMGVRRREVDWKNRIETSVSDNREAILNILHKYAVPLVDETLQVEEPDDYRMSDYGGTVPLTVKGAHVIESANDLSAFLKENDQAVLLDVYPAARKPDNFSAADLWIEPYRQTLTGAIWLANTGLGVLPSNLDAWYMQQLEQLTQGNKDKTVVIFCEPECWHSWNAAKRAASYGYSHIYWYRQGVDGWQNAGLPTQEREPLRP